MSILRLLTRLFAKKVLELTDKFAGEGGMCTMMITH